MKPHVILNAAMSLNGKIGRRNGRVRFSNDLDKRRVHELRSKVDAIMVGINTILVDNPKLTAHHIKEGKNPIRVIVDSKARTPLDANILNHDAKTIIAVSKEASSSVRIENLEKKGVEIIQTETETESEDEEDEKVNLVELMEKLYKKGIKTLLLEGGGTLNKSMISLKLVDEIYIMVAPMFLGDGVNLIDGALEDEVKLKLEGIMELEDQVVLHYILKGK
jgi:2,5-diamino-6-(ribosylamino)-4(3H)-pyrimidinone 5'-phosphate reductase